MSLLTDYLAAIATTTANTEAAQKAAKVKAEQDAKAARSALLAQRAAAEDAILESAGLDSDYQELLEVEAVIAAQAKDAVSTINVYKDMVADAQYAADLVEKKAQSIESLVSMMEADGLLADQIEATKKSHLDSAVAAHNAAKAAKDRIAKLLANKKIK
jgi:hypothetical protein